MLNQTASFRLTLSGPVLLSDLISPPITLSATLLLLLFSPPSPRLLATTWGYSMLGLPVLHYPPELAQTHVHRVGDATQPSHPLPPPFPPALSLSQHQGLSNDSALHIRWPSYWSFSFSISASSEYSGLTSFRMDWFDLLAIQGTLKSLRQYHSSKASVLWHSAFFMVQLSHPYTIT